MTAEMTAEMTVPNEDAEIAGTAPDDGPEMAVLR
jgi:hypothetical protein